MKLKPQQRFVSLEASGVQMEARTVDLTFSSEARVPRFYGTEILSHARGAANLTRMNNGAPLLFNHNMDDVIGVVESASIGDDKRGHAKVRFANTPRGNEVLGMVQDKILRNVSFMYSIDDMDDSTPGDYVVTSWEGMEISIVTVPADASVGVGRAADRFPEHDVALTSETAAALAARTAEQEAAIKLLADAEHERLNAEAMKALQATADATAATAAAASQKTITPSITAKEITMTPEQIEAARIAELAKGTDSAALERIRIKAINALTTRHKIDPAQAESWIDQGMSDAQVGVEILKVLDVRAQRESQTVSLAKLGMEDKDVKRWSLFRAMNAVLNNDWKNAGLELEAHKEIQKRTNADLNARTFYVPYEVQTRRQVMAKRAPLDVVGGGPNGGYLIETVNQGFIDLVRNTSVLLRAGATEMSGMQGNVSIPKQTGAATAYWLADDTTSIPETEQTFGQISLTPHNVGAYTTISRQLMLQSSPSAEGIVMADLAKVTALAVDKAGLQGSGTGGQPTGILNTTGVGVVLGTTAGYATLASFQADAAASNLLTFNSAYVANPLVAALLMGRNRFANTDTPLWQGNMLDGIIGGFQAFSSNQIAAAGLLFGDFSQVILASWGTLAVEINPYAIFQAGIIGVRAISSIDIGVRYGAAFSYAATVT